MALLLPRFSSARYAPTCILGEAPQFQGAGLRLRPCECGCANFVRIRRSPWMRVLPLLRLYQCRRCSAKFLHTRIDQKTAYGYVYRPVVTVAPQRPPRSL